VPGAIDDRQMTETTFIHQMQRVTERLVRADRPWFFGHHRSNRGLRWIAIASHHTENDVALRADADQIVVFDDENGGRVPLLHDDCGITNRGVVSGGRKGPLTYDFAN